MIDMTDIAARLKTVPGLKTVGSLADLGALAAPPSVEKRPAAYVIPLQESAAANEFTNWVDQRVECVFGVVLIDGRPGDATGSKHLVGLGAVRRAVWAALLGWQPPGADEIVTYRAGDILEFKEGAAVWQETFATAYHLQSE